MKRETFSIPGIKKIGWVRSFTLPPRVDLKAVVGERVMLMAEVNWLEFSGFPECRVTREKENHTYREITELSFVSAFDMPREKDIAIVVVDVDGEGYIIGSRENPKPVITAERNIGIPSETAKAFKVKVSHTAFKSLVPCNF